MSCLLPRFAGGSAAALVSTSLATTLAAALLTGCPSPPSQADGFHQWPVSLASAVLLRNTATNKIDVLAQENGAVKVSHLPFSGTVGQVDVARDGSKALFLQVEAKKLTIADAKTIKDLPLPTQFGAMAAGTDPDTVALWHPAAAGQATILVNSDEVALAVLSQPAGPNNPQTLTLPALGHAPTKAWVSEVVQGQDGPHHLLIAEAPGRLGIADFGPGNTARAVVVPLTADPKLAVAPIKTILRPGAGVADLFLIPTGLNDMVHVHVDLGAPTLQASLDQVAAGSQPADLHVFDVKEGLRAVTVNLGSQSLALLDPASGTGLEIPLAARVTQLRPMKGADGVQRLLGWNPNQAIAYLVNLDDLPKKKGKAISAVDFGNSVLSVATTGDKALVRLNSGDVSAALLNAVTGNITEFQGVGDNPNLLVTSGPGGPKGFLLATVGQQMRLSRVDLTTLAGETLNLNIGDADNLLPLGGDGVVALGAGLGGYWALATPTGSLDAKKLQWFEGYGMAGLLQRGSK